MTPLKQTLATLAAICLTSVLFTACTKDTLVLKGGGETTGDSSYQPLAVGTNWKYATDYPNTDTTIMTVTSATKTFNGKAYHVIQSQSKADGSASVYYYNNKHLYNYRASSDGVGDLDFVYLNDTAKVNYTWTSPVTDDDTLSGMPAHTIGKIVEKGISKTIEGKTYKDVIHTSLDLQYAIYSSSYTSFATYDFYVAKGVGIIEIDASTFGVTSSFKILDYQVK